MAGGSYSLTNSCLEMERDAYAALNNRLQDIEPRILKHCTEVGQMAGGSYSLLQSCIEMEEQARDEIKKGGDGKAPF